jgi:uncharacterized protein
MAPMPADHALHIVRCRSVHTFGMRFALDLVWLARDGRVVRVDRGVAPRSIKLCLGARSVVEAVAGEGERFLSALVSKSNKRSSARPAGGYTGPR